MTRISAAILCIAGLNTGGALSASTSRELVHPFPPTGPYEVAGTTQANKMLRTMQHYAVPPLTDLLALHVANTLQGASESQVVVTRRPRRVGRDAIDAVSAAPADGRTLLLFNGLADGLQQVASVASMPYVLVAAADAGSADVGDLIRAARAAPGRSFIASAGEQSPAHAAIGVFRRQGLPIEPLAYNGGYAALQAAAARHVSAALVPLPTALPYLPGGRIRALAIAEGRRHPAIAAVPTNAEAGLPAFEASTAFGVFAPATTPPAVVRELDARLAHVAASEHARQTFYDLGLRLDYRQRGITGTTSREAFPPPS